MQTEIVVLPTRKLMRVELVPETPLDRQILAEARGESAQIVAEENDSKQMVITLIVPLGAEPNRGMQAAGKGANHDSSNS